MSKSKHPDLISGSLVIELKSGTSLASPEISKAIRNRFAHVNEIYGNAAKRKGSFLKPTRVFLSTNFDLDLAIGYKKRFSAADRYMDLLEGAAALLLNPTLAAGFLGDLVEIENTRIIPKFGQKGAMIFRTVKVGSLLIRLAATSVLKILRMALWF